MALCKNEEIKLLIKMENLIGTNEELLFGKNKDKVYMVDKAKISHEDFVDFINLVEQFKNNKSNNNDRQKQWNKDNKEYHNIINNICNARKRKDYKRLEYWNEKLEKLKNNKKLS